MNSEFRLAETLRVARNGPSMKLKSSVPKWLPGGSKTASTALRARMRRRDAGSGRYVVTFAKGGARNLLFVTKNGTAILS